jgi:putative ABC transport system permease protein
MNRPRWIKLYRDLWLARGRMVMLVVAIAAGIFSVGLMLTAYTVASEAMRENYLGTHPASTFMELDRVDAPLVEGVRQQPGIADAEAASWVTARVEVSPNQWMPLLLFVIPDFSTLRISTVSPQAGAFPPPEKTILVEREVLPMLNLNIGDSLTVQTPNGTKQALPISGTVHDPSLAPAWQEQTVYGYITPATLAALGESDTLHILKIAVREQPDNVRAIEATVTTLAAWLKTQGRTVDEIRIPPPNQHPHQGQMNAVMMILIAFSLMALVLSAVLTATMIGGLLAQQIRQIGMMKAIGARSNQIAGMYLLLVAGLGTVAVIIGTPFGILAGQRFATAVGKLLNLTIDSSSVPGWVYGVLVLTGVLIPVLVALQPIRRTTQTTVREILVDYGASTRAFGVRRLDVWLSNLRGVDHSLLLAFRNTFRRRARLLLALGLLGAAGGMFMTGINVKSGWETYIQMAAADRHYDLEIRFNAPQEVDRIAPILSRVSGVEKVESWNVTPAAVYRDNGLDIVRTYPDGGHGSFSLRAAPPESTFIGTPMLSGRWLQSGDTNGVVLNQSAAGLFPDAAIGSDVQLLVEGRPATFRIVGILRQILSPATAYVIPETYAAAIQQPAALTNAVRVAMQSRDLDALNNATRQVESSLAAAGISIKATVSEALLDNAVSGHVYIFIVALILIAVVMAIVGAFGLTSSMSTSVIERTREFGIMRAIGAQSQTILRNVISEGVLIGLMSWLIALPLSLLLSSALGTYLGDLAFRAPLPLILPPVGIGIWFVVLFAGSIVASALPAQQAARLTVRETLAYV